MAKLAKDSFETEVFGRVWGILVTSSRIGSVTGGLMLAPTIAIGWQYPILIVSAVCSPVCPSLSNHASVQPHDPKFPLTLWLFYPFRCQPACFCFPGWFGTRGSPTHKTRFTNPLSNRQVSQMRIRLPSVLVLAAMTKAAMTLVAMVLTAMTVATVQTVQIQINRSLKSLSDRPRGYTVSILSSFWSSLQVGQTLTSFFPVVRQS